MANKTLNNNAVRIEKVELGVPDQRMVDLIIRLKEIQVIRFRQSFLDVIGMSKQQYTQIENGKQHFTIEHITIACRTYNVNANWIFGLETKVFRGNRPQAGDKNDLNIDE